MWQSIQMLPVLPLKLTSVDMKTMVSKLFIESSFFKLFQVMCILNFMKICGLIGCFEIKLRRVRKKGVDSSSECTAHDKNSVWWKNLFVLKVHIVSVWLFFSGSTFQLRRNTLECGHEHLGKYSYFIWMLGSWITLIYIARKNDGIWLVVWIHSLTKN